MRKVAVVTGASRGIGRAIAFALASRGFILAVHFSKSQAAAEEVVREITANSGTAFALKADLEHMAEIKSLFSSLDHELTTRTGTREFDVLVNNAGIAPLSSYREMAAEEFDRLIAVNVRAPFFLTQMAVPRLRDGGRIINISSLASRHASPSPITVAYSISKAALDALTVGTAQDLGKRQITVNTIAPGTVATDMNARFISDPAIRQVIEAQTALGRIGAVEDIANIACFLASPKSQWITGEYIHAGGGFRL